MNWALLREETSVAETPNYGATLDELRHEGKIKGEPPSIGLLVSVDSTLARPYLKPGESRFVEGNVAETEQTLVDAVTAGRIRTNKYGLLRAKDVRREFSAKTGRKHGRGGRRHFDADEIERAAAYCRNNPKPPGADLEAIRDRDRDPDDPDALSAALSLSAMKRDTFTRFVRRALEVAEDWLANRSGEPRMSKEHPDVIFQHTPPSDWAISSAELERQRRNLDTWRSRRGRPRKIV